MNDFWSYLRKRQLAEEEGAVSTPGLGDMSGPKEFGDDPHLRGGTSEVKDAFDDLSDLFASAMNGGSGKALLNQVVGDVMKDSNVPDRIKKEIEQKVRDKWSAMIDLSDKYSRGKLPDTSTNQLNPNGTMDPVAHKNNIKASQADVGF